MDTNIAVNMSSELREFCGYDDVDDVPDGSKITRFKQDFARHMKSYSKVPCSAHHQRIISPATRALFIRRFRAYPESKIQAAQIAGFGRQNIQRYDKN